MTQRKPYLVRALFQWIIDNQFTPYIVVATNLKGVVVPQKYIQNDVIVLDISPEAVINLNIDNEWLTFNARFGGVPMNVQVPMGAIIMIYPQESQEEGEYFEIYDLVERQEDNRQTKLKQEDKQSIFRVIK